MKQLILTFIVASCFMLNNSYAEITLFCPDDIDLGCNPREIPKPDADVLKYKTDCREAKVWHVSDDIKQDGCQFTLYRVYAAQDACQDQDKCEQIIKWTEDKEKPKIYACPEDLFLGCSKDPNFFIPEPDLDGVKYEDNCGKATVEVYPDGASFEDCTGQIRRRYVVTDACGNSAECIQILKWYEDEIPPTIVCVDLNLGCNPDGIPEPLPAQVIVNDNCCVDGVKHIGDSDITVVGCQYSMIRKYQATDCCGNTSICNQSITWTEDKTPPVIISCPQDIDLGCNPDPSDILVSNETNLVKAEDRCSEVEVVYQGAETITNGCRVTVIQTYVVSDACGNTSACSRKITYTRDTQAPIITECPPDLIMECPGPEGIVVPEPDFSLLKYEDDCGGATVEVLPGLDVLILNCQAIYTRGFVVTDACGNSAVCQQKLTWTWDVTPPEIECINIDLGCNPEGIPDPLPAQVIVTDDCCVEGVEHISDSDIVVFGCNYSMLRKYMATDCCGNTAVCDQWITWVVDNEPPVIIRCPEDLDLGCNHDPSDVIAGNDINLIVAEDNCGDVKISYEGSTKVEEGCTTILTHRYIVSDECGNTTTCSRDVKFTTDEEDPIIISCPDNLFLGSNADPDFEFPEADPSQVIYEDNCGEVSIEVEYWIDVVVVEDTAYWGWQFIVTDACGNSTSCVQGVSWVITPVDPGGFDYCPEGTDFGCVREHPIIPEPDFSSSGCEVYFTDQLIDIGNCQFVFRRWVVVGGDCKESTCYSEYTWTLIDGPADDVPFPADQTIFCGEVPPAPVFPMTNSCGIGIPILMSEIYTDDCDDGNCTVKRIWRKQNCMQGEDLQVQVITLTCQITSNPPPSKKSVHTDVFNRNSLEISSYPNPASTLINIEWSSPTEGQYSIRIMDITGKIVWTQEYGGTRDEGNREQKIDVSNFNEGMHFIQIANAEEQKTIKWIKVN